jgi:hypothetical protein
MDFAALASRMAAGLDGVRACLIVSGDGLSLGAYPEHAEKRAREIWERLSTIGDPQRGFFNIGEELWVVARRGWYAALLVAGPTVKPGVALDRLESYLRIAEEARVRETTEMAVPTLPGQERRLRTPLHPEPQAQPGQAPAASPPTAEAPPVETSVAPPPAPAPTPEPAPVEPPAAPERPSEPEPIPQPEPPAQDQAPPEAPAEPEPVVIEPEEKTPEAPLEQAEPATEDSVEIPVAPEAPAEDVPQPEPEPEPEPEPVPEAVPEPLSEPQPEPQPVPESEPVPEPEPEPAASDASPPAEEPAPVVVDMTLTEPAAEEREEEEAPSSAAAEEPKQDRESESKEPKTVDRVALSREFAQLFSEPEGREE